jgi:predicted secreted protein
MNHNSKRQFLKLSNILGLSFLTNPFKLVHADDTTIATNVATNINQFEFIKLEFENRSYTDILKKIEERTGRTMIVHPDIKITAPDIADTGAFVGMSVDLQPLKDSEIQWVALLSEKNPYPFIGIFRLTPLMLPMLETTVKMAETGRLTAVVFSNKKGLLVNHRFVQVVIGGCA